MTHPSLLRASLAGMMSIAALAQVQPYSQIDLNVICPVEPTEPELRIPASTPVAQAELNRLAARFRFEDPDVHPMTGARRNIYFSIRPGELHDPGVSYGTIQEILADVGVREVMDAGGTPLTPSEFMAIPKAQRPARLSFWSANLLLLALEKACRNRTGVPVKGDLCRAFPIAMKLPKRGAWVGLTPMMYWADDQQGLRFRMRKQFLYLAYRKTLPLQAALYPTLPPFDHFQAGGKVDSPSPKPYAPTGTPTRAVERELIACVLEEQALQGGAPASRAPRERRIKDLRAPGHSH